MNASGSLRLWQVVMAVTLCSTVFTAMQGLSYPLLSLILHRLGEPEWVIGVNATMMPLGMIAAAPCAPFLMSRMGGWAFAATSLGGASICMLAIGAYHEAGTWIPLRAGMGFCLGSLFVITETWINEIVGDDYRGRVLGLYVATLSLGFALGPGLLVIIGSHGWAPFLAGALLPLIALLPLFPVRKALPSRSAGEEKQSIFRFMRMAPLLLVCAGAAAFADEGAMSLLPIYALSHGYSETVGNVTLMVMIAGSIAMQLPIGWLADRISRTFVTLCCALLAALSVGFLPLFVSIPALFWLLVFVWGGAYNAIYMLSLIRLGESFRGATLVAGNAAFGAMWGLGGIAGPSITGAAMTALGPSGFPLVFAVVFAGIALAVALSPHHPSRSALPTNEY